MRFIVVVLLFTLPLSLFAACSRKFNVCDSCDGHSPAMGGNGGAGGARGGESDGLDSGAGNGAGQDDAPLTCSSDLVLCEGACIDPKTNRTFCGASDDCKGKLAGISCDEGDRCDGEGGCILDCPDGMINCSGQCIEPRSDPYYCGASGSCDTTSNWGDICEEAERCSGGVCRTWGEPTSLYKKAAPLTSWNVDMNHKGEGMATWVDEDNDRGRPFAIDGEWIGSVDDIHVNTSALMPDSIAHLQVNGRGRATVLRRKKVSSGVQILARRYEPDEEAWSDLVRVDANDSAGESEPDFVVEPNGKGAATWGQWQVDEGVTEYAQMFAFVGWDGVWTAPSAIAVSDSTGVSSLARREGRTAVSWTDRAGNRLRSAVHESDAWQAPKTLSEKTGVTIKLPATQMDAEGNVVVVWAEEEAGKAAIRARTYEASTAAWSPTNTLVEQTGLEVSLLRWKLSSRGAGLVVYSGTEGQSDPVWGCFSYHEQGWELDCEMPVPSDTELGLPQLAMGDDSIVHLAWVEPPSGGIYSIDYRLLSRSWSEPSLIATHDDTLDWLDLRQDEDGRAVVVWAYDTATWSFALLALFR